MYDFRINQPAFVQALGGYKSSITTLTTRQTELEQIKNNMARSCTGMAVAANIDLYRKQLSEGNFAIACLNMEKLSVAMEEALPEINALLVRCEDFYASLDMDNYLGPPSVISGDCSGRNGGWLALNYQRVATINVLCNSAVSIGDALYRELSTIVSNLNNELPNADILQSRVENAKARIERIDSFQESFAKYEQQIKTLDDTLQSVFGTLAGEVQYTRVVGEADHSEACQALTELSGCTDYAANRLFTSVETEADSRFVACLAEGSYKEAFAIDMDELSDGMKGAVSLFMADLIGGGTQLDAATTEQIINAIYELTYDLANDSTFSATEWFEMFSTYTETLREQHLVCMTNGLTTGYDITTTCSNLAEANHFWNSFNDANEELFGNATVCMEYRSHERCLQFENFVNNDGYINFNVAFRVGEECYVVPGETAGTYTGTDALRELFVNNTVCSEATALRLSYSVNTPADAQFLENFLQGNYEEAFSTPVLEISDTMKDAMSAALSEMITLDEEGGLEEVQNIFNTIYGLNQEMYSNNTFSPIKWIETLAVHSGLQRDLFATQMMTGQGWNDQTDLYCNGYVESSALFLALYAQIKDAYEAPEDSFGEQFVYGQAGLTMDDLKFGEDGKLEYDLSFWMEEPSNIFKRIEGASAVEYSSAQTYLNITQDEIRKLQNQIESLRDDFWNDVASLGLAQVIDITDNSEIFDNFSMATFKDDCSEMMELTDVTLYTMLLAKAAEKIDIPFVSMATDVVSLGLEYQEKYESLQNLTDDQYAQYYAMFFGSSTSYIPDRNRPESMVSSTGMYDPDKMRKIAEWNSIGMGFMLTDQDIVREKLQSGTWTVEDYYASVSNLQDTLYQATLLELSGLTEEERQAVAFLIYGKAAVGVEGYTGDYNSIFDIPNDIYINAINAINSGLDNQTYKDAYKDTYYKDKPESEQKPPVYNTVVDLFNN